jgi:hypothetical protein
MKKPTTEIRARLAQSLGKVHDRQREYQMFIEPPAESGRVQLLRQATRSELNHDLPEDYVAFLELSDGIDWNGAVVYGTERKAESHERPFLEGFLEANQALRDGEPFRHLLALGESGMELYVYEPQSDKFSIIDRLSVDTYETCDSFDDLLDAILRNRL